MKKVAFTVDVNLLAELGERLVGKPSIALAELVKNAYDADATQVNIKMADDAILVVDNGHGMSPEEMHDGFLRVGTSRKQRRTHSPELNRRMTGSKGVGRLAAQMLGRMITVETRSRQVEDAPLLRLHINWDDRTEGEDLTKFTGLLEEPTKPDLLPHESGTVIRVTGLTASWSQDEIEELAREIWTLRSPLEDSAEVEGKFRIEFESKHEQFEAAFKRITQGWIDLHEARLDGELHQAHDVSAGEDHPQECQGHSHVHLTLSFGSDEDPLEVIYQAASDALSWADFQIRIYKLKGRQPLGLTVSEVREYLNDYGGVYIYDEGFRLPYYGPDTDWLGIEMDHSHRRTRSRLLPDDLQTPGGSTFLPTTSRIFGAVHVSTSREREAAQVGDIPTQEHLQIQVSRDRLLDTEAYRTLRHAVRWAIDLYAHEKARRRLSRATEKAERSLEAEREVEPATELLRRVKDEIPPDTFEAVESALETTQEAVKNERTLLQERTALLGTLATAGMAALALEHEQSRLLTRLEDVLVRLARSDDPAVQDVKEELDDFKGRLNELRAPFLTLMEEGNRERARLRADAVVDHVLRTSGEFLRGISVERHVPDDLMLPPGSLAEWTALLQNVLVNAANAVMSAEHPPRIRIDGKSHESGSRAVLRVLDNGVGVDLSEADELFEPFERRLDLPPERRALGMGGTGLGLTIVRAIAGSLNCEVRFRRPPEDWSTCLALRWSLDPDMEADL